MSADEPTEMGFRWARAERERQEIEHRRELEAARQIRPVTGFEGFPSRTSVLCGRSLHGLCPRQVTVAGVEIPCACSCHAPRFDGLIDAMFGVVREPPAPTPWDEPARVDFRRRLLGSVRS